MQTIPTADRREVQVDTLLAKISDLAFRADRRVGLAIDEVHHSAGDKQTYKTRTLRVWGMQLDAAIAANVEGKDSRRGFKSRRELLDAAIAELAEARLFSQAVDGLLRDASAQYTGWTRFFLVANTDGHIHRSTRCQTCHISTRMLWLPTLSGLTEGDAVAEHGPRLCSVCFPSAPVEWTLGVPSDKNYCPGSDKRIAGSYSPRAYVKCPDCGKTVGLTQGRQIRKHAAAKAKATAAA